MVSLESAAGEEPATWSSQEGQSLEETNGMAGKQPAIFNSSKKRPLKQATYFIGDFSNFIILWEELGREGGGVLVTQLQDGNNYTAYQLLPSLSSSLSSSLESKSSLKPK